MLGLTPVLCLLPFLTPGVQGPLEPSSSHTPPATSSCMPDLLFSAVARTRWLHSKGALRAASANPGVSLPNLSPIPV